MSLIRRVGSLIGHTRDPGGKTRLNVSSHLTEKSKDNMFISGNYCEKEITLILPPLQLSMCTTFSILVNRVAKSCTFMCLISDGATMRNVKPQRHENAGHDIRFRCKSSKLESFVSRAVRVAAGIKHANLRLNPRQDLLFQFSSRT